MDGAVPGMSVSRVEGLRKTDRQICCCPGLSGSLGAGWVYVCSHVGLRGPRVVSGQALSPQRLSLALSLLSPMCSHTLVY